MLEASEGQAASDLQVDRVVAVGTIETSCRRCLDTTVTWSWSSLDRGSRQSSMFSKQRGIVYSNHGCIHDYHALETRFLLKGASTAPPLASFDHFHHFHMHAAPRPCSHQKPCISIQDADISAIYIFIKLCPQLRSFVLATSSCSS